MLETRDWRALGTGVRLVVHDGDADAAREAVCAVLDEVDRTYSRFRLDSELMRIATTSAATARISPLLARAIGGALDAARRSGGALDPTVGRAMRVIGYDADFDLIAARPVPLELRVAPVPGWSTIRLDASARLLAAPPDVELDLGATGKGLAADLAAQVARAAAGDDAGVLVSLGGDIAVAGRPPVGGWRITLADDSGTDPDAAGPAADVIAIERGAVATSSTTVRRWRAANGTTVHHIVDPRTGLPADTPWRTVTVAAATCEEANGASTAAVVLGAGAAAWLEAQHLPARLVAHDGHVVRVAGWPAPLRAAGPLPESEPDRTAA